MCTNVCMQAERMKSTHITHIILNTQHTLTPTNTCTTQILKSHLDQHHPLPPPPTHTHTHTHNRLNNESKVYLSVHSTVFHLENTAGRRWLLLHQSPIPRFRCSNLYISICERHKTRTRNAEGPREDKIEGKSRQCNEKGDATLIVRQ